MITLIPAWAQHHEEFWNAIRRRNLWFIKLRYAAVIMLLFLLVGIEFVLELPLTKIQITAIVFIMLSILGYNLVIHWLRKFVTPQTSFNNLHLSLLMMILDLVSLTSLIHYSGGIENPLYMFYIFHMIIGSLILPGIVIYSIATAVIISFSALVLFEYYGIIQHHNIAGVLTVPIYDNLHFILIVLVVFSLMMYVSVFLANKIARQLYEQEQKLWESIEKLNEAEKVKQKYVIGIVHEIKSPIAAVESYIDLIIKNYVGPVSREVEEKLLRAKTRTDEAIKMINNVLHISKLRLLDEIADEEISIVEIAESIISKQKVVADSKNIELVLKKDCEENAKLFGDHVLIEIALSNILNNAIKYVGDNGRVEMILRKENENCVIEICDNGIGIPVSDQEKIFDEFYRASNIKHKGYEGTGLGLSLVNQIIKKHNGNIKVLSPSRLQTNEKPGTSFIISFPIKRTITAG
ncbi:MAG: sensor histidine kinase [Ignavibacteriales bacterium]|nr:MAG: sensor histidine kinase [Ignavibacteriales bacterium]